MFSRYPATIFLILLNVAVFIATYLFAGTFEHPKWTLTLMKFGAEFNPLTLGGEWYRVFSHMFLHAHIAHLVVNMLALFSTGRDLESSVGTLKFLAIYFISGTGAALASLYWSFFTIGVGASGAIFGLFGFLVVASIIHSRRAGTPVLPIVINFAVFLVINVAVGEAFHADHAAHFGGLITGALLGILSIYVHHTVQSIRSEYVLVVCFILIFFALPRYQVQYYRFFQQLLRAENEGKSLSQRNLSDNQFLAALKNNNAQWDSAHVLLKAHDFVPAKLASDTFNLMHYIRFRKIENDYKIRMIRDETYILFDSLDVVQDSLRKYLTIQHPIPVNLQDAVSGEKDSADSDHASGPELSRVWYDSNWVETESPGPYYRLGYKDSLDRWDGPVRDFYSDGQIQMKGLYKHGRRDGIFLYYSHHNTYTSAGRYVDNRSVGKWQSFHNNGRLKMEAVYGNGVFYKNAWDSTGAQQIVNGEGVVVEYYPSGRKRLEGRYEGGNKEGFWTGWHEDGTIHFREDFRRGRLVYGKSRNTNGDEFIYDTGTLLPRPAIGLEQFEKYLMEAASRSGVTASGKVRLSFRVTASSVLTDFDIETSLSAEADRKAIDILRKGPRWIPAKLYGYQSTDGFAWVDIHFVR